MNVSLNPQLEKLVQDKVKSGRYLSASEVIQEGLRLLEERDRLLEMRFAQLQEKLTPSIVQADQGELIEAEDLFAEMIDDIEQAEAYRG